jgi:hypothetical protein
MLFQASRAVTASSEMSRFISVSEYAPPSPSLLILACIETLGANSGANRPAKSRHRVETVTASCTVLKVAWAPHTPAGDMQEKASQPTRRFSADVLPRFSISS